jgi:hypothetical protein
MSIRLAPRSLIARGRSRTAACTATGCGALELAREARATGADALAVAGGAVVTALSQPDRLRKATRRKLPSARIRDEAIGRQPLVHAEESSNVIVWPASEAGARPTTTTSSP